jgi:hypothetical protein
MYRYHGLNILTYWHMTADWSRPIVGTHMSSGGFKGYHPKQSIKKGEGEREQPVTFEECGM